MTKKFTVEIASYPKSGNTWMRYLVSNFLKSLGIDGVRMPADLHGKPEKLQEVLDRSYYPIPNTEYEVSFYKSHVTRNEKVNPDKLIYIYRHPLDVLLSTMNWFYFNRDNITDKKKSDVFKDGLPKSVDEIHSSGEMDFYIERYTRELGYCFFTAMLGEKSNYGEHTRIINEPGVFSIQYEVLLEERKPAFLNLMSRLLESDFTDHKFDFDAVDEKTKKKKGNFYWKARSGARFDYFAKEKIENFNKEHKELLDRLGYDS